jgi:sugar phosphate isomerase/epimerase
MTLGPTDLVLCSGTLAPTVSFRERVDAAVAGGFAGISLWGRDYERARADGLSDADIRAELADRGLVVAELDGAWAWLPGAAEVEIGGALAQEAFFQYREDDLFRLGDAVGARSINAVDVFGGDWGVDDAAEAFASLCDRAAEHNLLVHLEFLPWSRIPDVATAWTIVDTADPPNGGIAVDSWHFFRGSPDWDTLASVPGGRVLGIQLSDGPEQPEDNLISATLRARRLPGAGDFDLARLVGTLEKIGAAAPVGVEIFSDELHAIAPDEAARRAGDATRALLT